MDLYRIEVLRILEKLISQSVEFCRKRSFPVSVDRSVNRSQIFGHIPSLAQNIDMDYHSVAIALLRVSDGFVGELILKHDICLQYPYLFISLTEFNIRLSLALRTKTETKKVMHAVEHVAELQDC